jgi:hypothetical protein
MNKALTAEDAADAEETLSKRHHKGTKVPMAVLLCPSVLLVSWRFLVGFPRLLRGESLFFELRMKWIFQ